MMHEVERCQKAIDIALSGRKVAVVSSGDAGIYGMAGLVLELMFNRQRNEEGEKRRSGETENQFPDSPIHRFSGSFEIEVIPGVPAFSSAASLLGAPIMHDFASISLSDLLTPYDVILKRITSAAEGDFVIILYNPKSKKRIRQIEDVREILLKHRSPSTPVGIVKGASREHEEVKITTLGDLPEYYEFIDMQTIVIIGNSSSCVFDNWIVTPRGYKV